MNEFRLSCGRARRTVKRASAAGGDDNLAHALMEWAAEFEPDLLLLGEELPSITSASRLSLEELKKEVCICMHRTLFLM